MASQTATKTSSLVNGLRLLAHVPSLFDGSRMEGEVVVAYCAQRERQFPYFRSSYLDIDLGRATEYTDVIRSATAGYALADERGQVLQTYRELKSAEKSRQGAVVKLTPDLTIEPEAPAPQMSAGL